MAPIVDLLVVANGIYTPNPCSFKTLGSSWHIIFIIDQLIEHRVFTSLYMCAKMSSPKRDIPKVDSPPTSLLPLLQQVALPSFQNIYHNV